jgi:DNA-binding transcriptional MerR regulator
MLERHRDFSGTAEEFSELAAAVFRELRIQFDKERRDPREAINERLIRYYVQEGLLSPPDRQGREAHFKCRHLIELLLARKLINEGWTLAMARQFLQAHSPAKQQRSLAMNQAQRLVWQFAAGARAEEPPEALSAPPPVSAGPLPSPPHGGTRRREMVRFELAPWCHVDIDVEALLRGGSPGMPQRLGAALARLLRDEIFKRGRNERTIARCYRDTAP